MKNGNIKGFGVAGDSVVTLSKCKLIAKNYELKTHSYLADDSTANHPEPLILCHDR